MEIELKLREKLSRIQLELKAPKSQYNSFGGYKYRNAEDILEAVKPLLDKYACALICSDEMVQVGERYYVKATATLLDVENDDMIQTTAFAREEETKKGMDGSQISGASSSYSRKYALNGLFCIDDTKDSDTTNVGDSEEKPKKRPVTKKKDADEGEPILAPLRLAEVKLEANTEAEAISLAQGAKTPEELTEIWKVNRAKFGESHEFIMAISKNPNNPKKRG